MPEYRPNKTGEEGRLGKKLPSLPVSPRGQAVRPRRKKARPTTTEGELQSPLADSNKSVGEQGGDRRRLSPNAATPEVLKFDGDFLQQP